MAKDSKFGKRKVKKSTEMNILQKIARTIISRSFKLSVSTIEYFSAMEKYHKQVAELRKFENGTLGKDLATCLDKHDLNLVPKYESHDLKHVLLEYEMNAEGEIRLQAFMIGNGNYSIPSFAIFLFGAMLLPDLWFIFYSDFKKGRTTIPLSTWTIEKYAPRPIDQLRDGLEKPKPIQEELNLLYMKRFTHLAALMTVFTGVFGMLFCLPFLFSSNIADLVGAGFPFVAGAILVAGGLLALSNLTKEKMKLN